jgi:ribose-phosphate pyrophosphokinase
VVGPDAESRQWAQAVAEALGAPWRILQKQRRGDADVALTALDTPLPAGATAVVVDDIASSGATLLACAQALRRAGATDIVCAVVHGLFRADLPERLREAGVRELVCGDSVPGPHSAMPLAPALATAVRELKKGG